MTLQSANLPRRPGSRHEGSSCRSGPCSKRGGKQVHVWAVEEDWNPETLVSNTFGIEWPPRSGQTRLFPEIDRAQWFSIKSARTKILKGQSEFLDRLELLYRGK